MYKAGKVRRSIWVRTVLFISLLILFSGCSNEDNSKDSKSKENKDTAKAQSRNIVVAIPQDPDFLDPHLAEAAGTREVLFNVFEGLLKPTETGELANALAEDYKVSDDGLTYTFKLRKNVEFHDGKTFSAKDVQYSYERLAGTKTGKPLSSSFSNVASIEAPDDSTVVIKLKENEAFFPVAVTAPVIPDGYEDSNKKPIGTGPFKFVEYAPNQKLVLEKHDKYYADLPEVEKVEFRILPDQEAAFLAFQAGEIDIYPRIGTEKQEQLGDGFTSVSSPQNLIQLLALNHDKKPFNDEKVRKALFYAVNADELIQGVALGKGTKVRSNMSPIMDKFYEKNLEGTYAYDPEKAKKLLTEAGYPDGFKLKITVPSNYQFHVDTAQVIIEQLSQVGVKADIELVEWSVWLEEVYKKRNYETTIIGLDGKLDPYQILDKYLSTADNNFFNYRNPKFDKVLGAARTEKDEAKRVSYIKDAQRILNEDAAAVYIMDPNTNISFKSGLDNYKLYPIYVQDISAITFKK